MNPTRRHRHVAAACAAVALSAAPAATRASSGLEFLLFTGAPSPVGADLTYIGTPYSDANGQIAFYGGTGPAQNPTVFRLDPSGTLLPLAAVGQTAPGAAGGTFTGIGSPYLTGTSGYTLFWATTSAPASNNGLFRADAAGALSPVVRAGDPAPATFGGSSGTFDSIGYQAIAPNGDVAFQSSVAGTSSSAGIFRYSGSTLTSIARTGDPVPGTGFASTFTGSFTAAAINAAGNVAFSALYSPATNSFGIFRYSGSALSYLARTGDPAPGGGTYTTSTFANPSLNASGQVAFTANTSTTPGVFRAAAPGSGTVVALARGGDPLPNGGGTFTSFGTPFLNASGQAAFFANTSISGVSGLYRSAAQGAATEIARAGNPAPGGGNFSSFSNTAINSAGVVAFTANLSGASIGAANNYALYLSDGTDRIRVFGEGDGINSTTITNILFNNTNFDPNTTALDDFGRVTFVATLSDGNSVLLRYTPEINWRSTATTASWDTAANWTLGLSPAAVHDVYLHPTTTTLITGPSANTTIHSLVAVGPTGAPLTLRLNAGGNLTVQSYFEIDSGAHVELANGTLTADTLSLNTGDASLTVLPGASVVANTVGHSNGTYSGPLTIAPGAITNYYLNGGAVNAPSVSLAPGGSLNITAPSLLITPTLTQTGGSLSSTPIFYVGPNWVTSYALSAGTASLSTLKLLTGGTLTQTGGSLTTSEIDFLGGTLTAPTLTNTGTLSYSSGTLAGKLANYGTLTLNADFAPTGGIDNFAPLSLPAGRTVTSAGSGLTNFSSLTLAGSIAGTAPLTNDYAGTLAAQGTINPQLVNNGSVSLTGLLTATGGFTNAGSISLSPTQNLRLGASSTNAGRLLLSGAAVTPTAPSGITLSNNAAGLIEGYGAISVPVSNTGGVIHVTGGPLSLPSLLSNSAGGELRIDDNLTLTTSAPFSSSGLITLRGPGSTLAAAGITNTGTIQGAGRVTGSINNAGRIQADGPLVLSGAPLTNSASGTLKISSPAASLTLAQGLATNAGNLSNLGGSFSNNNLPLTNTGTLSGFGNFAAGAWTNNGTLTLTGGTTTLDGPLTNSAGKTLQITSANATFTSPVTNNGSIKLTSASAVFAGGLSGNAPAAPSSVTLDPTSSALTSFVSQDSVTNAGSLTLRPSSGGGAPSTLNTLTLLPNSSFDLADNPLTVVTTAAATIRQYLLTHELFSSLSDPTHSLAYLFSGEPTAPSSVLIDLTLIGDANRDGKIDADDYALLDRSFAQHTANAYWWNGDFNYDGVVNLQDYLLIDTTYTLQSGSFTPDPSLVSERQAQFGPAYVQELLTSIPEPSSLLAACGLTALLPRRRPRHRRHFPA